MAENSKMLADDIINEIGLETERAKALVHAMRFEVDDNSNNSILLTLVEERMDRIDALVGLT